MTNRNEDLKESFPLPTMIAFRQPPNLKQLICKSKLHDVQNKTKRGTRSDGIGWKKCGNGYPICPFTMNKRTELTGKASKFNHKITQNLNCDTENIIYYWNCIKSNCPNFPECEYIGT